MYQVSAKAKLDLQSIYRYSYIHFGLYQAKKYHEDFLKAFELLAQMPLMGREVDHLKRGLFKYEHRSHSIFYTQRSTGIFIVRVLHNRMNYLSYF